MIKRALFAAAVLVPAAVLSQSACKKDEPAATSSSASGSVAGNPSGAASLTALESAAAQESAAPTADIDKLPTPTVHATAAAKAVTSANYKAQLDSVEKELNAIK